MWKHIKKAHDWGYSLNLDYIYVWEIKGDKIVVTRRKNDLKILTTLIDVSEWEKVETVPKEITDFVSSIRNSK